MFCLHMFRKPRLNWMTRHLYLGQKHIAAFIATLTQIFFLDKRERLCSCFIKLPLKISHQPDVVSFFFFFFNDFILNVKFQTFKYLGKQIKLTHFPIEDKPLSAPQCKTTFHWNCMLNWVKKQILTDGLVFKFIPFHEDLLEEPVWRDISDVPRIKPFFLYFIVSLVQEWRFLVIYACAISAVL